MKQSTVCRRVLLTIGFAVTVLIVTDIVRMRDQCATTPKRGPEFADDAMAAMNWAYITGDVSRFILGGEIVYCFGRINGDPVTCYGTNTTRVNE